MDPFVTLPLAVGAWALYSGLRGATKVTTPPTVTEPAMTLPIHGHIKRAAKRSPEAKLEARLIAPELDTALKNNKHEHNYLTGDDNLLSLVIRFQQAAGIFPDGLYGPVTSGALMHYLGRPPPPPFFFERERMLRRYKEVWW